jgi:hypothetical protein
MLSLRLSFVQGQAQAGSQGLLDSVLFLAYYYSSHARQFNNDNPQEEKLAFAILELVCVAEFRQDDSNTSKEAFHHPIFCLSTMSIVCCY